MHIDGFTLGALNIEPQLGAARHFLELAKSSHTALSVDLNRAICDNHPDRVRKMIPQADVLFANAYEALTVTGVASPEEAARTLVDWGVPSVVVKNGSAGLICATRRRLDCLPAFETRVADSIGAGGGVAAGTLWGLLRGLDLPEAARVGAAVAALVFTGHGSQGADCVKTDVDRFLEKA